MKRWLVLTLGLGLAAIAGVSLLTGADIGSGLREPLHPTSAASAHDEIDQASRDQLQAILREADRDGAKSP